MYAHETHAHEVITEEPEMKSVIKDEPLKELEDIVQKGCRPLAPARLRDKFPILGKDFFSTNTPPYLCHPALIVGPHAALAGKLASPPIAPP
jgi:hypothetical protein